MTYKTFCLTCRAAAKDRVTSDIVPIQTYYGETHVSSCERGVQHERDFCGQSDDSHMFKHYTECHSDMCQDDVKFGMQVIKQHYSSFSRQVHEFILIFMNKHNVLNSCSMYNRCKVPRLTTMLDDKEEKAPGIAENNVDKVSNLKRKRTRAKKTDNVSSSVKRPRVLSVTQDDAGPGDQGHSSSTTTHTQHFPNSQRVSDHDDEVKLDPTITASANKF